MIKLLNTNNQVLHLLTQVKDFYIESELATADKLMSFRIPKSDKACADLRMEYYLQTETDEFVIKEINSQDKLFYEVYGKPNVEELKGKQFVSYESINAPISVVMGEILNGLSWDFQLVSISPKNRTIRGEFVSVYDIIIDCANTYGVEIEFDTIGKTIKIYSAIGNDRGAYIYSDLNLKKTDLQSDTYDYKTRLYAYGAEGLTFADINGGKEYVDNFSYSNKIIELIWKDERYTTAQTLLEDATARLEKLAKPRMSFSIEVINLAKTKPEYSVLDFRLGDTVKIIDKDNQIIDTQRIVKLIEYPMTPELNKADLANSKIVFVNGQKAIDTISHDVAAIENKILEVAQASTNLIKAGNGGYVVMRYNENNQPYEMLMLDNENLDAAMNVWRWNVNGLGFSSSGYNGTYKTAITADGKVVADFITTGTLNADLIKAGVLQSADGSTWINLDDGSFSFGDGKLTYNSGSFNIDLSGSSIGEEIAGKANQSDIDEIHSYFQFGNDGLTISKDASPFRITISNEQIDFIDNGTSVAYINGQKMYITSLDIVDNIVVGVHQIEKFNNSITLIRYIGGEI